MPPAEETTIIRKQSFKPITTRKYPLGPHIVPLIINGQEKAIADFILVS
ncbi:hypothetical protein [Rufibacter sp. XAAS-G3-1]|nr:hypothetical protein [Rufibacter sp. XAAS-G3-1]